MHNKYIYSALVYFSFSLCIQLKRISIWSVIYQCTIDVYDKYMYSAFVNILTNCTIQIHVQLYVFQGILPHQSDHDGQQLVRFPHGRTSLPFLEVAVTLQKVLMAKE